MVNAPGPLLANPIGGSNEGSSGALDFVRVSATDPRYLTEGSERVYIPIGCNLAFPRTARFEEAVVVMEAWLGRLAAAGGNYTRIWLSHPAFDAEVKPGVFDGARLDVLRRVLDAARRHRIRVKVCLDFFRHLKPTPPDFPGSVFFGRPHYARAAGGFIDTMADYFATDVGRSHYLTRLDLYAALFRDDPIIYGWELWNEIDAVEAPQVLLRGWTRDMLAVVKERLPNHMVMQSLGSLDAPEKQTTYEAFMDLPGNDVSQVHRYLNQGASLAAARGAMDVLAADATRFLVSRGCRRPVMLAEVGAVEIDYSGPSALYPLDRDGVILHDSLFAPFFSGAAGPGHSWFWDHYISRNDLWVHFTRFKKAIEGFDPSREGLTARAIEQAGLRLYLLEGRAQTLVWVRDGAATWETELIGGKPPRQVVDADIDLGLSAAGARVFCYDPWTDHTATIDGGNGRFRLPRFRRSITLRIER